MSAERENSNSSSRNKGSSITNSSARRRQRGVRRHGNTPPLCRRDALFNEASRPSHPIYRRSTLPPRRVALAVRLGSNSSAALQPPPTPLWTTPHPSRRRRLYLYRSLVVLGDCLSFSCCSSGTDGRQ